MKPEFFVSFAIAFICAFITASLLSSCTFEPYWKDGVPMTQDPAITETSTLTSPDALEWSEYTVTGTVNIRSEPDASSESKGWLLEGAVVLAICSPDSEWCEVPGGYVLAGCLGYGDGKCGLK